MAVDNNIQILISLKDATKQGLKSINGSMKSITDSVFNLKSALAGLGAGLALRDITNVFTSFDDQMRLVGAVANATGSDLKNLTALAEEMGSATRYSASQAGEGLQYLAMAGFDVQKSMEALPGVLELAAANQMDLGTASDITTNVLSGLGLAVEELSRVNDVLTKTAFSANTNVTELGEAFKIAGPAAKGSGIEIEEVSTILGALANNGIKGAEGGHAVKRMLLALQAPTGKAKKQLEELGVEVFNADGSFRGLIDVIKDLGGANLTLVQSEQIFGKYTATAAVAAAGAADSLDGLNDKLLNASGTAEKAAEQMEAGLGGAIRSLMSAWEGLKIAIGRGFESDLASIINYLKGEINSLKESFIELRDNGDLSKWLGYLKDGFFALVESVKVAFGIFTSLLSVFSPIIEDLASFGPIIAAVVVGFVSLSKVIGVITGAMALMSSGWVASFGSMLLSVQELSKYGALTFAEFSSGIVVTQSKIGLLTASTSSLSAALTTLGALGAAFGVGWGVGRIIGEFETLGEEEKTVNDATREWFETLDLLGKYKGLEEHSRQLLEVASQYEEFKNFKLPENLTDKTNEDLNQLNANLYKSQTYWLNYKNAAEDAKQLAVFKGETEEAERLNFEIVKANKNLSDLAGEFKRIADVSDKFKFYDFASDVERTKSEMKSLQVFSEQIADARIKTESELYQKQYALIQESIKNGEITFKEGEEKKIQLAKEYQEKQRDIRVEIVEAENEELLNKEIELLEKRKLIEVETAKAALGDTEAFLNKRAQLNKEYDTLIGEQRKQYEQKIQDEIKAIKDKAIIDSLPLLEKEVEAREKAYDKALIQLEKNAAEEIRIKQEINERKEEIDEFYNLATVSGMEAFFANMEGLYEQEIKLKQDSILAKQKLDEENINLAIDQNSKIIEVLEKRYDEEIRAKVDAGIELEKEEKNLLAKYEEAKGKQVDLENQFSKFKIDKVKETAQMEADLENARLQAIEAAYQKINSIISTENEKRSAEQTKQLAQIQLDEAKGVISVQDAANQKKQIELDFAQFKINQANKAAIAAAEAYDMESSEYQKAVAERTQAEAELITKQAEAAKGQQEIVKQTAEATREVGSSATAVGDALDRIIEQKQRILAEGGISLVSFKFDETKNNLNELRKIIDETSKDMSRFSKSMYLTSMMENSKNQLEAYKAIEKEFQNLRKEAASAGLSINNLDMTLEEATQDMQTRVDGWTSFKDAIADIKNEAANLKIDFNVSESSDAAAQAFRSIKDEANNLSTEIDNLNKAFATGSIADAQKMADGVIGSYKEIYDKASNYINSLKADWDTYYGKVQEINNKILALNQSAEDQIRELRRQTMTEAEQWQDRRLEYETTYQEATIAAQQKNFELADELFAKAKDIAGTLAQEVTDESGNVIATIEQNTSLAIGLIEQTQQAATSNLTSYSEKMSQNMKETEQSIQNTTNFMDSLGISIGNTIAKTEQLSKAMKFENFAPNREFNIDFTGTGSSKKPISEKIKEIASGVSGMFDNIKNNAANLDFTGMGQKVVGSVNQTISKTGGNVMNRGAGLLDELKDFGKLEIPIGDTTGKVLASKNVANELKRALKKEGLVGAN